jgi:predicted MFS family arabinose efflux permease
MPLRLTDSPAYRIAAGFLCLMAGLGLCRYAFAPLLPALIEDGWTSRVGGAWLGAINFGGYVVGALAADCVARRIGRGRAVMLALLLAVGSLGVSGLNLGWWPLAAWRMTAGMAGGVLFVIVPSLVMQGLPQPKQAAASGLVFAGSGTGTMLAALLLPLAIGWSVPWAWWGLAVGASVALLAALPLVLRCPDRGLTPRTHPSVEHPRLERTLWIVAIAYALLGIGIVPHSLYLSDYLFEDYGVSLESASERFALLGVGSLLGGAVLGSWGCRWWTPASRLVIALGFGLVGVLAVTLIGGVAVITGSTLVVGFALMGCGSVMSQRVSELAGLHRHTRYWGRTTLCFGVGYAAGAIAMAVLLSSGWAYIECFWLAAVGMAVSLLLLIGTRTVAAAEGAAA